MWKILSWFDLVKKRPYAAGVLVIVLLGGLWLVFVRNGNDNLDILQIHRGDFTTTVSVAGTVVADNNVSLAFTETGRVDKINVLVGQTVKAGAVLVTLAMGTLPSDLRSAEANLALRRAENQNTAVSLEEVRKQQDTLVANAYRKLLSSGLSAVPDVSNYSATAPSITGLYNGPEGTYKAYIKYRLNWSDFVIRTFDLETTDVTKIFEGEPTALGTRGLFISFPDALADYDDTTWNITIPNPKSSVYLSNYNLYQDALRTREHAISSAQAELTQNGTGLTVAQAQIEKATAEVARIKATMEERILRAPFTGVVTVINAKVGQIVYPNVPEISMISGDIFQIESYVPEVNVSQVALGDEAVVYLDAYGGDIPFSASVITIDPAETVRDGISTYKIVLQFKENDQRVRSGMTASITITTDSKPDSIVIPQGALINKNAVSYVELLKERKVILRIVETGLFSVGQVEITSGLNEGDVIVLNPDR